MYVYALGLSAGNRISTKGGTHAVSEKYASFVDAAYCRVLKVKGVKAAFVDAGVFKVEPHKVSADPVFKGRSDFLTVLSSHALTATSHTTNLIIVTCSRNKPIEGMGAVVLYCGEVSRYLRLQTSAVFIGDHNVSRRDLESLTKNGSYKVEYLGNVVKVSSPATKAFTLGTPLPSCTSKHLRHLNLMSTCFFDKYPNFTEVDIFNDSFFASGFDSEYAISKNASYWYENFTYSPKEGFQRVARLHA